MMQTNGASRIRGWLRNIPSLIVTTVYASLAWTFLSALTWGTAAVGLCLLAMTYVRLDLTRLRIHQPDAWDSENENAQAAAIKILRRAGYVFLAAIPLMFIAWIAGEGWGWLVGAAVGLWLAIVVFFRDQLGPRDMPARWFP